MLICMRVHRGMLARVPAPMGACAQRGSRYQCVFEGDIARSEGTGGGGQDEVVDLWGCLIV